jgi:hypothetical protein
MLQKAASLSSVCGIRAAWTEIPGGIMRQVSYSMTVFHDGTMIPTFRDHVVIA